MSIISSLVSGKKGKLYAKFFLAAAFIIAAVVSAYVAFASMGSGVL